MGASEQAPEVEQVQQLRELNMAEVSKGGGDKMLSPASIALPGRKLATSTKARMLTASEIELLRQDLGKGPIRPGTQPRS
jgi:hypothetical protein